VRFPSKQDGGAKPGSAKPNNNIGIWKKPSDSQDSTFIAAPAPFSAESGLVRKSGRDSLVVPQEPEPTQDHLGATIMELGHFAPLKERGLSIYLRWQLRARGRLLVRGRASAQIQVGTLRQCLAVATGLLGPRHPARRMHIRLNGTLCRSSTPTETGRRQITPPLRRRVIIVESRRRTGRAGFASLIKGATMPVALHQRQRSLIISPLALARALRIDNSCEIQRFF